MAAGTKEDGMIKKALTVCVVTLAASMALAQASSLNVSQTTRNAVDQLLNTNLSETNLAGTSAGVANAAVASGKATGADASMTGNKVKAGVVTAGQFVTQDTALPVYDRVLTPTGHAAVNAANWLRKSLPADVSVAADNVVATIELTGTATSIGVTEMGRRTKVTGKRGACAAVVSYP